MKDLNDEIVKNFKIVNTPASWPSSDSKATPFVNYECQVCGTVLSIQMGGSYSLKDGEKTFADRGVELLGLHLIKNHLRSR